ncbi:MAG: hypothetical protein EBY15_02370 [Gammaproteobacteria bacterium]|nr:hypothetical protein [Gammaproteobacteria bacterium]
MAAGLCQVSATKQADSAYAATTSRIESVYVVLAPQAALNLTASNTGIAVGSTSTLSASGGSGTGTVAYQVLSGPCTLNGALLTGSGAGTCRVLATKAADGTYAQTSSNEESVYVVLAPQPILTLIANPSSLNVGGTSSLSTLGADGTYAALSSNLVSVLVNLAPQAPLNLTASNTSISVGSTSTLSASGGSGNGTVTYRVLSGPCLLNGAVLTGSGAGTCLMTASRAADSSYGETTSNTVSVLVNLIPQSGLNLTISTPSLTQGGTATLTATGGSGSGTVFYEVLSGPCTLNGNSLIGRGPGSCVVRATKAQSNGYAETTSNSVVESVTAPTPTPAPIPTLPEWAKITMMFLMFLTVGWYGWRLKR